MPFELSNLFSAFIVTCERVLRERDDVTSLIRLVDLFEFAESATAHGVVDVRALTVMKSRTKTSGHAFDMEIEFPDGSVKKIDAATEDLKPLVVAFGSRAADEATIFGAQVVIQLAISTQMPGAYILRARLDGQEVARTMIMLRARKHS